MGGFQSRVVPGIADRPAAPRMNAGTSREGRLLGDASRIDGHSLDWSLERMTALYRYARARSSEKGDNPNIACPLALPVAAPRGGARIGSGATLAARVRV